MKSLPVSVILVAALVTLAIYLFVSAPPPLPAQTCSAKPSSQFGEPASRVMSRPRQRREIASSLADQSVSSVMAAPGST